MSLLFIDEISMASAQDLALIDMNLRKHKQNPSIAFGGVSLCVLGDFSQLPTVAARNLYSPDPEPTAKEQDLNREWKSAETKERHGLRRANESFGHRLWTSGMNFGVELTESKRAEKAPQYAAMLERFRTNQPSDEDLTKINERVLSNSSHGQRPPTGTQWLFTSLHATHTLLNYTNLPCH